MKKLNNNGWGLSTELIWIIVFVVCLIVAIWGAQKFGLIDNINKALNPGVGNIKITQGDESKTFKGYEETEKSLIEATKKYVMDNYDNDIGEDTLIVRVNHLIKNKYLETIYDDNGKKCSGYIEVKNISNNSIVYSPYLKCKGYKTPGYEERKDW